MSMRSNKICFWICIAIVFISIVLTCIFEWVSIECGKQIYTLLSNVAISLLGGAILAAATAAVSFENQRKQSIIRFCSDYIKQVNIINEIANLCPSISDNDLTSIPHSNALVANV